MVLGDHHVLRGQEEAVHVRQSENRGISRLITPVFSRFINAVYAASRAITLHKLQDIVMIVLCAVISDTEDWVGMLSIRQRKMYTGLNYEYRYQVIFGTKVT